MGRLKTQWEGQYGFPSEFKTYLDANTKLAQTAIKSHKTNFKNNFLYILIGFIFSISGTVAIELIKESETELLNKQLYEINALEKNRNIEFQRMRSEIESLKIELTELKSEN